MAYVGPLGFLLGLPFPALFARAQGRREGDLAWCLSVNAFASVVATVGAIPIALVAGYSAVLASGILAYGAAAWARPRSW